MLPSQLRTAFKCLLVQRRHPLVHKRPVVPHRDFSQSAPREASENPDSIISQLQASPIMRKLADKPEALRALHDFAQLLRDSDISISPESPPSTMQMFKLAANPKFREGAKRMVEELRRAGIDINAENAFELFGLKPPGR